MEYKTVPSFGHLMCLLGERVSTAWHDAQGVVRSKMTLEECGMQCQFWADEYPTLAADLHAVAAQYIALSRHVPPRTPREPGEDRLEDI